MVPLSLLQYLQFGFWQIHPSRSKTLIRHSLYFTEFLIFFISEVVNPCGKKPSVYIYQGMKPGFSAKYVKSGRSIPGSSRNAEAYARKLARAGHKKVVFRD